jgi:hypothetical protein
MILLDGKATSSATIKLEIAKQVAELKQQGYKPHIWQPFWLATTELPKHMWEAR